MRTRENSSDSTQNPKAGGAHVVTTESRGQRSVHPPLNHSRAPSLAPYGQERPSTSGGTQRDELLALSVLTFQQLFLLRGNGQVGCPWAPVPQARV